MNFYIIFFQTFSKQSLNCIFLINAKCSRVSNSIYEKYKIFSLKYKKRWKLISRSVRPLFVWTLSTPPSQCCSGYIWGLGVAMWVRWFIILWLLYWPQSWWCGVFILASYHTFWRDRNISIILSFLSIRFIFVFYLLTNFEHWMSNILHFAMPSWIFVQHFVHHHPANLVQHRAAKPSPFCHLDLLQHEHLEDHQEQRQRLGSLEQKTGEKIDLKFDYNYK